MANRFNGEEVDLSLVVRMHAEFYALLDVAVDKLVDREYVEDMGGHRWPLSANERQASRENWKHILCTEVRKKVPR